MHQHLSNEMAHPIGFGRTLFWAGAVTVVACVTVARVSANLLASALAVAVSAATLLYPFVKQGSSRGSLRSTFLGALLLLPSAIATNHPAWTMLAAATVIAVIRSWMLWPGTLRSVLTREAAATASSAFMGWYFMGTSRLDVGFAVWGFCLGQLVATLVPLSRLQSKEEAPDTTA